MDGGGLPSPAPPIQGAAGGGGRPGGAGEKRRGRRDGQGWEKLDRNRAGGAVSIRRDRGGSGVQGAGGTAGRSGRAEDGPVRPPTGRGVPSLGSGVWGDPRRGPGLCRRSGGRNAPPSGRQRGWRAPDGSRPPWNWPGGQRGTAGSPEQTGRGRSPFGQDRMSRFSGSMTPHGRWTGSFAGMPGGTTGALPCSERRISIEAGAHALQGLCVAPQPKGVLHRL